MKNTRPSSRYASRGRLRRLAWLVIIRRRWDVMDAHERRQLILSQSRHPAAGRRGGDDQ